MWPEVFGRGPCQPAYGGDKRDRTADPLLAKQVLSQLSYTPSSKKLSLASQASAKHVALARVLFSSPQKPFALQAPISGGPCLRPVREEDPLLKVQLVYPQN